MSWIISVLMAVFLAVAKTEDKPKLPEHPIHQILYKAEIPSDLWGDFTAVAACESEFDAFATGDGGMAMGLFQIHWNLWAPWAIDNGYGAFYNPYDPVQNAQLAYLIGQEYSMPRGKGRWDQWSAKPWPMCYAKAELLTEAYHGVFDKHSQLPGISESSGLSEAERND